MSPRLELSSTIIKRLKKLEDKTTANYGYLFGLMYDCTLFVNTFCLELDEESENPSYSNIQLNFPTELELCGIVVFGNKLSEAYMKSILQNVDMTDNPIVLSLNSGKITSHFLMHNQFKETQYEEVSTEQFLKEFVYIRLKGTLPLFCEVNSNSIKDSIYSKRKKIVGGQICFHFPVANVYLIGEEGEASVNGLNTDASIEDLMNKNGNNKLLKMKHEKNDSYIIDSTLLLKCSKSMKSDKSNFMSAVKMMYTQGQPSYRIKLPLYIDVLSMAHISTKLVPLYNVLIESACKSLKLLEQNLLEQLKEEGIGDGAGLKIPETIHFLPNNFGFFFSHVVGRDISDNTLESYRKKLHELLSISPSYPCFKCLNAYPFDKLNHNEYIVNPHEFLNTKMKPDARIAIVRGYYTYHHYLQDNFNDDGWGCAYRSLQTICSWFRFQGYTVKSIPTHKEIQQCLVSIGDKMSSFVGSKEWIGSTEVGHCLKSLIDVDVRTIHANSGNVIQDYAQELLYHFQKYGTPIMIGGGQYAYTILGVEYENETGNLRYLILDPHYTGKENIDLVIQGWCSWKTNDFWSKKYFYNLCLPLTPTCI